MENIPQRQNGKGWYDINEAKESLHADLDNLRQGKYNPAPKKEKPAMSEERITYTYNRYQELANHSTTIKNETKNFAFAKGVLGFGITVALILGGTHIGRVIATTFKNIDNNEPKLEQQLTPEEQAYNLVSEDRPLSHEEVELIKNVNEGKYKEPLEPTWYSTETINAPHIDEESKNEVKHVMTWSTEEGYTSINDENNNSKSKA